MKRRWAVAGGGTGGHVTPALALAERIRDRGDEVVVLGSQRGLEGRLVPEAGFELLALPAQPLMGRGPLARVGAALSQGRACAAAWRALGKRRIECVISVGGYASVPAVVAALARRVPVALVEPNAVPGRANRAAARFASRIFVQFEAAADALSSGSAPVQALGIPLRRALVEAFAAAPARRRPEPPFRLLVFGGSQGARQINDALLEALPLLLDAGRLRAADLEIFHQTGEADRARIADAYARAGLCAEVAAFEPEMPRRYRWADLALCRAGALTVAELALAGLPSLLVPYPFAADAHQLANAHALADAGAARVLASHPLPGAELARVLASTLSDPAGLEAMGAAAATLARPDAAEAIVAECADLMAEAA